MQGARGKPTNHHADLHRKKITEYAKSHPWFSITEAAEELKVKRHIVNFYVREFSAKGLLTGRTRNHNGRSRPPIEYFYGDIWNQVTGSNDIVVKYHLKVFKEVAGLYREGLVPAFSTLDNIKEDLGDEIRVLTERLRLLNLIYENPAMQNIQTFVKRMGTNGS